MSKEPMDRRQLGELIRSQIGSMASGGDRNAQKLAVVEQIIQAIVSNITALVGAVNEYAVTVTAENELLKGDNQNLHRQLSESKLVRPAQ